MRQEKYVDKLKLMIQKETISSMHQEDLSKFREFHSLLKELFPSIFNKCVAEDFEGSLLLRWAGENSQTEPVMFMNHLDVVEATGQWEHPPFSGDVADGKLWGRGTLDTKGGLFAMLQAADELAEEGFVPHRDIYFESACTEETTGKGANLISHTLKERGIKLAYVFDEGGMIMYDPIGGAKGTFAMAGVGEKGLADIKFTAKSTGGHSSTPKKNTPLVRLGKFMAEVDKKQIFDVELSPTINEMFKRIAPYMGMTGIILGKPKAFGWLLKKIIPSISDSAGALLKTTLAFTMAKGSDGSNVLPEEAYVIGNMRVSHHQGLESSLEAVKKVADKYDIQMEVILEGAKSGISDYRGEAFKLVEKAVKATFPKVDGTVPYIMTGASDSSYFDIICNQCIRFVPIGISESQMASIHGINENVDLSALVPAVDYYKYIMKEV